MKKIANNYYGVLIGICGIFFAVFAYLGIALQLHFVMLIGTCLSCALLGIIVFLRDSVKRKEENNNLSNMKKECEKLISNCEDRIIRNMTENYEGITGTITNSSQEINNTLLQKALEISSGTKVAHEALEEIVKNQNFDINKRFLENEKNIELAISNSQSNIIQSVEKMPLQTQSLIQPIFDQKVIPEFNKTNNRLDLLKSNIEQNQAQIITALESGSKQLSETQKNIISQVAILHRQNSHLMMLTTMIGTVRSDIAAINEVKAFVNEQKAGRKVRHVRDDEHGIFIENLMNSDGIRIEKSAMFKENKLVFEADFDESGRMTRSKNYSENSDTYTEITYSNGTVTKSILGKIFGSKK